MLRMLFVFTMIVTLAAGAKAQRKSAAQTTTGTGPATGTGQATKGTGQAATPTAQATTGQDTSGRGTGVRGSSTGEDLLAKCQTAIQVFDTPFVHVGSVDDAEVMATNNLNTGYCYAALRLGWEFMVPLLELQKVDCRFDDSGGLKIIDEVKIFVNYAEAHQDIIGDQDELFTIRNAYESTYCPQPK